jgi:hypothetical protein
MSDTPETHNERTLKLALEVFTELANTLKQELDEWAAMCGRYKQERDEAIEKYDNLAAEHMLAVNKFAKERDEARAVADELASVAAHCLGWHEHESSDAAIKIAAALKCWKKSK